MRECNEILLEVILIKPDFDSDDGLDDITQTLRQDFNESLLIVKLGKLAVAS